MPAGNRKDPLKNHHFLVEIDGIEITCFNEVVMPEASIEVVDYREGCEPKPNVRKLSGLRKYSNIILKRGVTDNKVLYGWVKDVMNEGAGKHRRNMSVVLLDDERQEKARWNFYEAWPCLYTVSDLNAQTNEVTLEIIEITFEGFERA